MAEDIPTALADLIKEHAGAQIPVELAIELMGHLEWSAEELAAARREGLRSLVADAKQRSAFYARRLAHLDPSTLTEANLTSIPPLTKAELMAHWDEIVTAPGLTLERCEHYLSRAGTDELLLEGYRVVATGGSSGLRAVIAYTDEECKLFAAIMIRWVVRWMLRSGETPSLQIVVAQVQSAAATHMSGLLGRAEWISSFHLLPVTLPIAEIVKGLNHLQPDCLIGYASSLRMLAQETLASRLQVKPRLVISAGEPLTLEESQTLKIAWGASIFDCYGTTEAGILAMNGGSTVGLYLSDDTAIVEPVDAQGCAVEAGERSAKLYVTPLRHRTVPLLRYELEDEVTLLAEPCPEGLSFRRIDHIQGRLDDIFTYSPGIRVHPIVFRSPLTRCRPITAYQVRQTPRGADIAAIAAEPFDQGALVQEIEAGLARIGLPRPRVTIDEVETIPRTPGAQKLRRFVPLPD
jgi:phenylacetate-coenzyme A ligase PaaK-like adenylate-forming protein